MIDSNVVTVTPEAAQAWLTKNVSNRPIRQNVVTAYARDMAAGLWHFLGDPIRFADNGDLLDGQHRLLAIIRSGVTVDITVITGIPFSQRIAVDTGAHRSARDHLSILGLANSRWLAPIARRLVIVEKLRADEAGTIKTLVPTHQEMVGFIEGHEDAMTAAAAVAQDSNGRVPVSASAIGSAYYSCSELDRAAADSFFTDRLIHTVGLTPTDPALLLRDLYQRRATEGSRMDGDDAYRYAIKAWNHWRTGDGTLEKLQSPKGGFGSRFPEPK